MNLSSLSDQFVFNLPSDFIQKSIEDKYMPILRKNHCLYDTVIDYLNSNIKDIVLPSVAFENVTQRMIRGKEVYWKSAKNIYDSYTRELDITFRSVNSHLNYIIMQDIATRHYLDTTNNYTKPLIVTILDRHRDAIFDMTFRSVTLKSLSEMRLSYSGMQLDEKTFTMQFAYNYLDIRNVLTGEDLLRNEGVDPPLGPPQPLKIN